jgi:hypothetical protein
MENRARSRRQGVRHTGAATSVARVGTPGVSERSAAKSRAAADSRLPKRLSDPANGRPAPGMDPTPTRRQCRGPQARYRPRDPPAPSTTPQLQITHETCSPGSRSQLGAERTGPGDPAAARHSQHASFRHHDDASRDPEKPHRGRQPISVTHLHRPGTSAIAKARLAPAADSSTPARSQLPPYPANRRRIRSGPDSDEDSRRHEGSPRPRAATRQAAQAQPRQEAHLVALHKARPHTSAELAELFSVARSTVYGAVQRAAH